MGLPVTVVAGSPGPAKSALIERWRTQALAPSALIIDRGDDFKFPRGDARPADPDPSVERIGGCACCSASMALGGALRKLMRRGDWAHLVVDLNGGAHPAAFIDALRSPPLSGALRLAELVSVIDAQRVSQWLAGPQRRWLVEQVQSSHRVLMRCPAAQSHADIEAQVGSLLALGGQGSFAAEVTVWREGGPLPVPAVVGPPEPVESASIEGDGIMVQLQAHPADVAAGRPSVGDLHAAPDCPSWRWIWRACADRVFERIRVAEVLGAWAGEPYRIDAVVRTERDWYRFQGKRCEPDGWRRDSRVQITLGANDLAGMRGPLRALADRLKDCVRA